MRNVGTSPSFAGLRLNHPISKRESNLALGEDHFVTEGPDFCYKKRSEGSKVSGSKLYCSDLIEDVKWSGEKKKTNFWC